jgi:hypothetical protein
MLKGAALIRDSILNFVCSSPREPQLSPEYELGGIFESFIFWDITSLTPLKANRCFGGIFLLHLQDIRIRQQGTSMKQVESS